MTKKFAPGLRKITCAPRGGLGVEGSITEPRRKRFDHLSTTRLFGSTRARARRSRIAGGGGGGGLSHLTSFALGQKSEGWIPSRWAAFPDASLTPPSHLSTRDDEATSILISICQFVSAAACFQNLDSQNYFRTISALVRKSFSAMA